MKYLLTLVLLVGSASPEVYCWHDLLGHKICKVLPTFEIHKDSPVQPKQTPSTLEKITPPLPRAIWCTKTHACV